MPKRDARIIGLGAEEARSAALGAAAGFPASFGTGMEGALEAIRAIGFVQIDTISVVERAHHHILRSRVPGYEPAMLPALEADPRRILEYWAHAAAYLPIEDYRYCLPRMARVREHGHDWYAVDKRTVARVRDRIRAEGPLGASDFQDRGKGPRGWWDRKPAKIALEYLFQAGELVGVTRSGFRKLYDLAERHLPPGLDDRMPSEAEMGEWYARSAARAYGVFARDDVAYQRKELLGGIDDALERLRESGEIAAASVEGQEGRPYWVDASLLARMRGASAPCASGSNARLFVLSPFDPFLIIRKRLERLFDTRYTLECYLPASKRVFGYFGLPLLYLGPSGASFAGAMDAKALRTDRTLLVRRLTAFPRDCPAEARKAERSAFLAALAEGIASFAAWNGADSVEFELVEAQGGKAFADRLRAAVARKLREKPGPAS